MTLALYIHWPFCLAKCPYCDFNSHVRAGIDEQRFEKVLLRELDYWQQKLGARKLTSIFFGGGTPSLMPAKTVTALIEKATRFWDSDSTLEISLEANPTSSEAQKFKDFRAAGVNRLSLGVQALHDADLTFLGREHTVDEALKAVALAAHTFPRFSFDPIYARKNQTLHAWEKELQQALTYAGEHLSLYQLTIEPNTVFAARSEKEVLVTDDDNAADMYELTGALCDAAGLPIYEVSNYAKRGGECRHNLSYWHYDDYVGIGAGAHGRVMMDGVKHATQTYRPPETWLRAVEEKNHGMEVCAPLTHTDTMEEALLMGLRLVDGIDKARWAKKFGVALTDSTERSIDSLPLDERVRERGGDTLAACSNQLDAMAAIQKKNAFLKTQNLQPMIDAGYLINTEKNLRITRDGFLKLNAITGRVLG